MDARRSPAPGPDRLRAGSGRAARRSRMFSIYYDRCALCPIMLCHDICTLSFPGICSQCQVCGVLPCPTAVIYKQYIMQL